MYLSSSYPLVGGRELYCAFLSKYLIKRGIDVKIYTSLRTSFLILRTILGGNKAIIIKRPIYRTPLLAYFSSLREQATDLRKLTRLLPEADIFHVHVPSNYFCFPPERLGKASVKIRGWILAKSLIRRPAVATVHGTPSERYPETYDYLREVRHVDHAIVLSEVSKLYFLRKGIKAQAISVIPPGVDVEIFCPDKYVWHQEKGEFLRILCPTRIDPMKGLTDLVKAVKICCNKGAKVKVSIVGGTLSQDYESQLKEYISSLSLGHIFSFLGEIPYTKMPEQYAKSDVVILPSYFEGLPLSLLEAMAMKKPVIATRVGGIPELITNNVQGILYEAGQINSLAQAILTMYEYPDLRRKFGLAGYNLVHENYNWNIITERILKIYRHLS